MSIIAWIVLGLLVGLIAKAIMPGAERIGIIVTTILGVVGAMLGGFLATAFGFGDPIDEFFDISHVDRRDRRRVDHPVRLERDQRPATCGLETIVRGRQRCGPGSLET